MSHVNEIDDEKRKENDKKIAHKHKHPVACHDFVCSQIYYIQCNETTENHSFTRYPAAKNVKHSVLSVSTIQKQQVFFFADMRDFAPVFRSNCVCLDFLQKLSFLHGL